MKTPPPTPDEELLQVLNETTKVLERLEGRISEQREHSVSAFILDASQVYAISQLNAGGA